MKDLNYFIFERFLTCFTSEDVKPYAKEIYKMIVAAYAYIGGLAGCSNYEDFVKEYVDGVDKDKLMYKLVRRNNKLTAVRIYTRKRGGRKSMCMASDGTPQGKSDLTKILIEDFKLKDREAYAEQSGKALGSSLKLGKALIPNYVIKEIMPDKEIKLLDDGFFYLRKIAGKWHCKALVGNPPAGEAVSLSDEDILKFKELSMKYTKIYDKD